MRQLPSWLDREQYPFQHRWTTLPGGEVIHAADEGAGPVVLFAHGTPTWSFEWRHLIRALSATYRCVAPDHLGFGLSDRPRDADYTPEAHARRFRQFVETLDLRDITLVVHDFGGPIALPLALDTDRVRRVVIINSWMWSFDADAEMAKKARMAGSAFARLLYRYVNMSQRVIMPAAYADRRKLTAAIQGQYTAVFPDRWSRGAVLWALARSLLGSSAHFQRLWQARERLGQPVLIVWGTRDPAFPPSMLRRWREALPHAQVVEVPEAGHWPHEESPAAVEAALRSFLTAPSVPGLESRVPTPR